MKGEETGEITQTDGQVATSVDYILRPQENSTEQIVPPIGGRRKHFSEVVKYQVNNKRYKITLKRKEATTTPE